MQLWDKLAEYAKNFSSYRTTMDFGDVAEILIIAVDGAECAGVCGDGIDRGAAA